MDTRPETELKTRTNEFRWTELHGEMVLQQRWEDPTSQPRNEELWIEVPVVKATP